MKNSKEKRKTGAARMIELGYKQVQLWLDPREVQAIYKKHPSTKLAALARRLLLEDAGVAYVYR